MEEHLKIQDIDSTKGKKFLILESYVYYIKNQLLFDAYKMHFQGIEIKLCHFHFGQNIH
jgi:hypothetical protein